MNEKFRFKHRLKSMLNVDFQRMFTMPLYYIVLGIAFVMPILILVMTSMMEGQVSIDPTTNEETVMHGFDYVWQSIASISGSSAGMSMDLVSMCNIDLIFFAILVLACLFVSEDYRSGYCKNLFTVRANKIDYIMSKIILIFVCGTSLLLAYFIGAMIGGAIADISFELVGVNALNVVMCMLSKIFLVLVFGSIAVTLSIVAKQKTWLSILISFGGSMLLFTMVSMISPLNSTFINVLLSLVGGILFALGLGALSNIIMKKTSVL